jgi:hypothetical protein
MSTSHVAASVRGDASAVMEDLDRGHREPYVDHFMDQGKGHGVIVAGKFQMIVNVDPGDLPFAVHKRRRRKCPEDGLIQTLEELASARLIQAHGPAVQVVEERGDPGIEFLKGKERLVPEPGQDPPLGHEDPRLNFRLRESRQRHGVPVIRSTFSGSFIRSIL